MTLHHVNPSNGKVGICHAATRACPFGEDNHFTSKEAAEDFSIKGIDAFHSTKRLPLTGLRGHVKSVLVSSEVRELIASKDSWSRQEVKAMELLSRALEASRESSDFEDREHLMREISSLHFAKKMLSYGETVILQNLEALQRSWLEQRASTKTVDN